jgi:hypothetical protein
LFVMPATIWIGIALLRQKPPQSTARGIAALKG